MDQTRSETALRYTSDPPEDRPQSQEPKLSLPPPNVDLPLAERGAEALRIAHEAFSRTGSWVNFYRAMLGEQGVVRRLFPTGEQMRTFEASPEFAELQEMIAAMRSLDDSKGDNTEPSRMITIRIPKSLHDSLRIESEDLNLSINKLCISKLLQRIESRFVPIQQGRRRGRRPGPQGPRKDKQETGENGSQDAQRKSANRR